jgi:hypothetical protein
MLAERDVLCRTVGEGQSESCLLVNGRCDRADTRVMTEYAQKVRPPVFPHCSDRPGGECGSRPFP